MPPKTRNAPHLVKHLQSQAFNRNKHYEQDGSPSSLDKIEDSKAQRPWRIDHTGNIPFNICSNGYFFKTDIRNPDKNAGEHTYNGSNVIGIGTALAWIPDKDTILFNPPDSEEAVIGCKRLELRNARYIPGYDEGKGVCNVMVLGEFKADSSSGWGGSISRGRQTEQSDGGSRRRQGDEEINVEEWYLTGVDGRNVAHVVKGENGGFHLVPCLRDHRHRLDDVKQAGRRVSIVDDGDEEEGEGNDRVTGHK